MATDCKTCAHFEVAIINTRLARGDTIAQLAERFGLSEDSLRRHRVHSDASSTATLDPAELIASLSAALKAAQGLAYSDAIDAKGQLEALREVRQCTEALAKLTGAYKYTDSKQLLPFWNKIKSAVLGALGPHPEAQKAVLLALEAASADIE